MVSRIGFLDDRDHVPGWANKNTGLLRTALLHDLDSELKQVLEGLSGG